MKTLATVLAFMAVVNFSNSLLIPTICTGDLIKTDCFGECPPRCIGVLPIDCTFKCKKGCMCKEGFVFDNRYKCIKNEGCKNGFVQRRIG
ncbi:unnamed protein product [Chironomus riparius]|uniref:TIL domain-containing protein n=1 Tax=Chironomus riparius TaxID=315576 RepID=A0A9N9WU82_9DIPT|nr:unnamed protein product [Chironomus riparius]